MIFTFWIDLEWADIKEFATTQTAKIRTDDLSVISTVVHQQEVENPDDGVPCGYGIIEDVSGARLSKKYNRRKIAFHLEHARYRDKVVEDSNVCFFLYYFIFINMNILQGIISRAYYRNPVLLHCLDKILSGPTCDLRILDHLPPHLKWPDGRLGSSNYIYVDLLVSFYSFLILSLISEVVLDLSSFSALPYW